MDKNQKNGTAAQGADRPIPDHDDVKRSIKRDLGSCIALLNAVNTDEDLLNQMATFILGRLENARMAEELKKRQLELGV